MKYYRQLEPNEITQQEDAINAGIDMVPLTDVGHPARKYGCIVFRPVSFGWVSLAERKPTVEDENNKGWLYVRDKHGVEHFLHIDNFEKYTAITHFHPIAKFAPEKKELPMSEIADEWITEKHAEYAAMQKESK